jgi:hypothetical protein
LRERIAQARRLDVPEAPAREDDDDPAWGLLDFPEAVEEQAIAVRFAPGASLERIRWDDVADQVYLTAWERGLQGVRDSLRGIKPSDVAAWAEDPIALVERLPKPTSGDLTFDTRMGYVHQILSAALGVALRRQGYTSAGPPTGKVYLEKEGRRLDPFELTGTFLSGNLSPAQWLSAWEDSKDCDLGALAPTSTPIDEWTKSVPGEDEPLVRRQIRFSWLVYVVIFIVLARVLAKLIQQ